ncbi:hypothetical protein [Flavobacterium gilvum]|uniref:Uncharacterized protein n=1 Tax=Flavobacterium gilvum TaxID=1492737 RepID=A0AAC9I365_9FLAO|nr:hypothetical protein [Flavobacterium gilvum]AOW09969.1 hypothetical protein EM308_10860 [Flavobacterium gilvum]AOW09984.1 hypothetical protein EM308_10945 [Flavobacterium gilvum]KFC59377.1 hypothetical protein FEM08_18490 [Flavobacterium gilvum]
MENSFRLSQKNIVLDLLFCFFSYNQGEMIDSNLLIDAPQSLTAKINPNKVVNLFKGSNVAIENDSIRSWINVKKETGMPVEIGIAITPKTLERPPENSHSSTIITPLYLKAKQIIPFDYIGLNWNPRNRPPPGAQVPMHYLMTTILLVICPKII